MAVSVVGNLRRCRECTRAFEARVGRPRWLGAQPKEEHPNWDNLERPGKGLSGTQ